MSIKVVEELGIGRYVERCRELMARDEELRATALLPNVVEEMKGCRFSIDALELACRRYGDRPAFATRAFTIEGDPGAGGARIGHLREFRMTTYRELWRRVRHLATGLRELGGGKAGTIINLIGFSTLDILVADLACHYLGVVSAPLPTHLRRCDLDAILAQCGCRWLFASVEDLGDELVSAAKRHGMRAIVVMNCVPEDGVHRARLDHARSALSDSATEILLIEEVERAGAAVTPAAPVRAAAGADPLMSLCFTSGSTGTPKAAMYLESRWLERWTAPPLPELAWVPWVTVLSFPANHMAGRKEIINSIKQGGLLYFTLCSDMSALLEDIQIARPTVLHIVPRISEMVYRGFQTELARRTRGFSADAAASIEEQLVAETRNAFGDRLLILITSSAPTSPETMSFLRRCFDAALIEYYATSESGQILRNGRIVREMVQEHKLADVPELGYFVDDVPHPRGELHVKTCRTISGYYEDPNATSALLGADGFVRTGDVFEQREDRFVFVDRKNNVLKLAQGEFVAVSRLEGVYCSNSRRINQIFVYGSGSRSYLLAVIVPQDEETSGDVKEVLKAELARIAREHDLRGHEVPRDFLVETTPFSRDNGLLTAIEKPARAQLTAKYGSALEAMYRDLELRQVSGIAELDALPAATPVATRVRLAAGALLGLDPAQLVEAQSLRELGGDSMTAARLAGLIAELCNVDVSIGFVLGASTALGDLIAHVEARAGAASGRPVRPFERVHGLQARLARADELSLERVLGRPPARSEPAGASPSGAPRTFLVSGATGFLGRFLLLDLLERHGPSGGRVYCLVRAKSDAEAYSRLSRAYSTDPLLASRFERLAEQHLMVVSGDVEQPKLGLPEHVYEHLATEVDAVVHSAALVNHALAYERLFDSNVLGTAEILDFALAIRPKTVSCVSTIGVALSIAAGPPVFEDDDVRVRKDSWELDDASYAAGYYASKWAGEVLARGVHEQHALPTNIFRCGMLLPHTCFRGQLNDDDAFCRLLSSVVLTGIAPTSFFAAEAISAPMLDGLPVDLVSAAIVACCSAPTWCYATYHVDDPRWGVGVSLDDAVRSLLSSGYDIALLDYDAWYPEFQDRLKKLERGVRARSALPIVSKWKTPAAPGRGSRLDASKFRQMVESLRPRCPDGHARGRTYLAKWVQDLAVSGLIPVQPAR